MLHKQLNMSRGTLFATLLTVAIAFQVIPGAHTERLNNLFSRVFGPVLDVGPRGLDVFRPADDAEETVSTSKYNELWKVCQNTEAELLEMKRKYKVLSGMSGELPKPVPPLVLAKVISSSIDGYGHKIVINAGTGSGIETGQYVLDTSQTSIVGSISKVSETTATVRLVTDAMHIIMVGIRRKGRDDYIEGPMAGDGRGGCKIGRVPRKEYDVRIGDTVYASAKRGLLDTPIVIGEVDQVMPDRNTPVLWDIRVRPIFEPAQLTELAVIVMAPPEKEE
ncbi:MAG: rod shape-determining protein MreC [Planctomycetes bacterium]|nr:rod shape-determining protein MreC [Planctomycetota bacterium]